MKWLAAITALAWFIAPVESRAATPRPPNIVFILTDDQRWDALSCAGNDIIQTPNVDRLAARGVLFRNNFVTTSICACSRASIFSGQYMRRHGIEDFATPFTDAAWRQTYPAILRQHGYRTGFIGKFGVGNDAAVRAQAKAFDFWRGLPGQGGLFFDKGDARHKTMRFGDEAMDFLGGCSATQPFCLSLSFTAPHARDGQPREFWPDPRDEKLYSDATMPMPKTATPADFAQLPDFVKDSEGRRRWERRFATTEMFQRTTKDYYRLITGIDREVGRIVAALAELHLADNTIIVFTSDNGFILGERGLADKWLMYEESIRVPLVIFDPRLAASRRGKTVDALTLNVDLAPTLMDFAGLPAPAAMQGRSLVPLLVGDPTKWRTDFFYEHHTLPKVIPPSEGVRSARWKYLRWTGVEPVVEELYDLRRDPLEQHDLAADPAQRATLDQLRRRWAELREELK